MSNGMDFLPNAISWDITLTVSFDLQCVIGSRFWLVLGASYVKEVNLTYFVFFEIIMKRKHFQSLELNDAILLHA